MWFQQYDATCHTTQANMTLFQANITLEEYLCFSRTFLIVSWDTRNPKSFFLSLDRFKSKYSSDFQGDHISDFLLRFAFALFEIDQLHNICKTPFPDIIVLKYKDICFIKNKIALLLKSCLPLSYSIPIVKNSKCTFLVNKRLFFLLLLFFFFFIQYAKIFLTIF